MKLRTLILGIVLGSSVAIANADELFSNETQTYTPQVGAESLVLASGDGLDTEGFTIDDFQVGYCPTVQHTARFYMKTFLELSQECMTWEILYHDDVDFNKVKNFAAYNFFQQNITQVVPSLRKSNIKTYAALKKNIRTIDNQIKKIILTPEAYSIDYITTRLYAVKGVTENIFQAENYVESHVTKYGDDPSYYCTPELALVYPQKFSYLGSVVKGLGKDVSSQIVDALEKGAYTVSAQADSYGIGVHYFIKDVETHIAFDKENFYIIGFPARYLTDEDRCSYDVIKIPYNVLTESLGEELVTKFQTIAAEEYPESQVKFIKTQ